MRQITSVVSGGLAVLLAGALVQAAPAQASSAWTIPGGVSLELSVGAVADIVDGPGNTKYVTGNFTTDDRSNPRQFSIGVWSGKQLKPMPGNLTGTAFALTYDTSTATLYAGGYFTIDGTSYEVVKWDGTAWSGLARLDFGLVNALADDDNGTLYVGGTFRSVNGATGYGNFAAYTSLGWSNGGAIFDDAVTSMVTDSRGRVYAGGFFTRWRPGDSTFGSVAVRDGGTWSVRSATNGRVTNLAIGPGGTLYGSGTFTEAAGEAAVLVSMRVNTEYEWRPVPAPVATQQSGMAFSTMAFTTSGNLVAGLDGRVYSLSGSTWTQIPGTFGGPIRIVSTDAGGGLLVGGSFVSIDGTPTPGLAYRSGKQAPPAPSVVDARVLSGRIITVTWSAVTSDPPVRTYRVECKAKAGPTARKQTTVRFAEITLPRAGTYACRVSARNSTGWGAWSAASTVRVR
jgi:hypothetical protein